MYIGGLQLRHTSSHIFFHSKLITLSVFFTEIRTIKSVVIKKKRGRKMGKLNKAIFITGTDTDVGKTFVSAWLCYHLKADYWKPIQTGERDSDIIHKISPHSIVHPENYRFVNAVSPHLAALQEKTEILLQDITFPKTLNPLVIEGAGGVLVPINNSMFIADLIKALKVPVLIVSRNALGTINHTCLTIEALKKRGIPILGIILNGSSDLPNKEAIESYSGVSVLATLPSVSKISHTSVDQLELPYSLKGVFE